MPRRRPSLNIKPPKMAHGDADRIADASEQLGLPLVPWQREFLNRLESASIDEQFAEIVRDSLTYGWFCRRCGRQDHSGILYCLCERRSTTGEYL